MKIPIGSYSFYNAFDNCPHKAFHIYVAKTIPYKESPEMAWGNKVHKAMEMRIKHGAELPAEMLAAEQAARSFADMAKVLPVRVEYQLAMRRDGFACDYNDAQAWFRGKLDCVVMTPLLDVAWMIDWKTGNVREDPFELQTGALLLKAHHVQLELVKGEYFWMKTGQNGLRYTLNDHAQTFTRLVNLHEEAETYLRAGEWPKRKNPLCGWCQVTSCEHNTSHKRK